MDFDDAYVQIVPKGARKIINESCVDKNEKALLLAQYFFPRRVTVRRSFNGLTGGENQRELFICIKLRKGFADARNMSYFFGCVRHFLKAFWVDSDTVSGPGIADVRIFFDGKVRDC